MLTTETTRARRVPEAEPWLSLAILALLAAAVRAADRQRSEGTLRAAR
jgi:hypothetical protein